MFFTNNFPFWLMKWCKKSGKDYPLTVNVILHCFINSSEHYTRWVPKQLTEQHNKSHVRSTREFRTFWIDLTSSDYLFTFLKAHFGENNFSSNKQLGKDLLKWERNWTESYSREVRLMFNKCFERDSMWKKSTNLPTIWFMLNTLFPKYKKYTYFLNMLCTLSTN